MSQRCCVRSGVEVAVGPECAIISIDELFVEFHNSLSFFDCCRPGNIIRENALLCNFTNNANGWHEILFKSNSKMLQKLFYCLFYFF
jgi:hypothetical protein